MHEIIYLQAGSFANHICQHFWNTQESYFDYSSNKENHETVATRPDVQHDVSFREGIASDGTATYLPRVLIFDRKDAFGSLSRVNELYESLDGGDRSEGEQSWSGRKDVVRQPSRRKPHLHHPPELEEGSTGEPSTWSDYTNVYYHPRSLYPVPYPLSGSFDTVDEGVEAFARLDQEDDVWETGFRLFAEECDLLQGLQVTCDASASFASFTTSFLARFRDEHPKHPILSFLPLSPLTQPFEPYNLAARRRLSCETRTIFELSEMMATIVPLQHPSTWSKGAWSSHLTIGKNLTSPYHTSALLSATIESATLPMRLNADSVSLASLTELLNYHADTPISHLTGIVPLYDVKDATRVYDFSFPVHPELGKAQTWSASAAYRGPVSPSLVDKLTDVLQTHLDQREPLLQISFSSLEYPLLSSFPAFLDNSTGHTSILSTLLTTPATAGLLERFSDSLQAVVDAGQWAGLGENWGKAETTEILGGIRNLREAYVPEDQETEDLELEEDEEP